MERVHIDRIVARRDRIVLIGRYARDDAEISWRAMMDRDGNIDLIDEGHCGLCLNQTERAEVIRHVRSAAPETVARFVGDLAWVGEDDTIVERALDQVANGSAERLRREEPDVRHAFIRALQESEVGFPSLLAAWRMLSGA